MGACKFNFLLLLLTHFLPVQTLQGNDANSGIWAPDTHVEKLDWVRSFRLSPVADVADIWGMNQQMRTFFPHEKTKHILASFHFKIKPFWSALLV